VLKRNPQFLTHNGKREYVVLPYDEFEEFQVRLEDAEDVLALELARREDAGSRRRSCPDLR